MAVVQKKRPHTCNFPFSHEPEYRSPASNMRASEGGGFSRKKKNIDMELGVAGARVCALHSLFENATMNFRTEEKRQNPHTFIRE